MVVTTHGQFFHEECTQQVLKLPKPEPGHVEVEICVWFVVLEKACGLVSNVRYGFGTVKELFAWNIFGTFCKNLHSRRTLALWVPSLPEQTVHLCPSAWKYPATNLINSIEPMKP